MSAVILLFIRLAMALALYGFLAWAIWTLWRDIKRQDELLAARRIPVLKLTKQAESGEVSYEFSTPDVLVGRDQTCDLVLDEKTVSAEHARLRSLFERLRRRCHRLRHAARGIQSRRGCDPRRCRFPGV